MVKPSSLTLIEAINGARDHVHMEYFILKDDGLGRDIMKALTERAREGVEVRLLVDGVGSGGLPKHFYDEFTAAGGKHAVFFPSLIFLFQLPGKLQEPPENCRY